MNQTRKDSTQESVNSHIEFKPVGVEKKNSCLEMQIAIYKKTFVFMCAVI